MKQLAAWTMFFGVVTGMVIVNIMHLLPKEQKYRICEDPDELGYWVEPVNEEEF